MKLFRSLLIAVAVLTLFPLSNFAANPEAGASQDVIWVAIRASDKGPNQPGAEYYGSVERRAFATAVNSPVPTGFLKLSHASWLVDGQLTPLSESNYKGTTYGYKDVVYIRMDTIFRIIELNDEFTKAHFTAPKPVEKPAGNQ